MEQNITKQSTNTLSIIIVSKSVNQTLTKELSDFIAPDGAEAREFIFTTEYDAITETALKSADLVIVTENEKDKISAQLKKQEVNYITVSADVTTDEYKDIVLSLEKALDSGFTTEDFVQIYNLGTPVETIRQHMVIFRNGIGKAVLEKPAVINDGIQPITEDMAENYAAFFDEKKNNFRLKKFVPASGAASRMFKFLCEFIAEFQPEKETVNAYINRKNATALNVFLAGIEKFPFYKEVMEKAKAATNGEIIKNRNQKNYSFIKTLLAENMFDYANKPKGILPFHKYENFTATPVYEHLCEAVTYAASNGQANVHFTISEEHFDGFYDAIQDVKATIEEQSGIQINYTFSNQHKETDTIAVDLNNNPFRDDKGRLVFRPGGHGALIENLSRLDADIVFIKNIDNVSHNNIHTIALYKKALAGMLIELQQLIFDYLEKLENEQFTEDCFRNLMVFAKEKLGIDVPYDVTKYTPENKTLYFQQLLNRPIRICGMVKNEGEPGGGPFWVKGDKGMHTLQIIESSQIDLDNKEQQKILADATHFNPVDLVCGLRDYKGQPFNLPDFVDPSAGFIVYKNKNGKDLKSYELPGLWNGAMAGWITLFVEVPLETFNPVKTVNDLLKPAHQPQ